MWHHISHFWLFTCNSDFFSLIFLTFFLHLQVCLTFVSCKLAIRFYFSELNVSLNSKKEKSELQDANSELWEKKKVRIVRLKDQNYLNFYSVAEISFHEKCIENGSSCWTSLEKQRCARVKHHTIKHPALQVQHQTLKVLKTMCFRWDSGWWTCIHL